MECFCKLPPLLPSLFPSAHQSAINSARCDRRHVDDAESHQPVMKATLSHDLVYHASEALIGDRPPLPSGVHRKTWSGRKEAGQYKLVGLGLSEAMK